MGHIIAISISKEKGVPKDPIPVGNFIENHGLEGDAHAGNWHRQVSFLGIESIEKMKEKGAKGLTPGIFAENLTTSGIELYSLDIGTKLQIGETTMEITQIGKECHNKCAIFQMVGDCVMPKEGVFAKVLIGGKIEPNDNIKIV